MSQANVIDITTRKPLLMPKEKPATAKRIELRQRVVLISLFCRLTPYEQHALVRMARGLVEPYQPGPVAA